MGNVKKYEYDDVIEFTNTGRDLDNALGDIQTKTKELRELLNDCEDLFHGKTADSSIYKRYKKIYDTIGTTTTKKSLWLVCDGSRQLIDLMHDNAISQKQTDEQADV